MRTITLLLGLVAFTPAFAGDGGGAGKPSHAQVERARQTMGEIAKSEVEVIDGIVDALDEMQPLPVSDAARRDYDEAKVLRAQAEEKWKAKEFKDAYMIFRDAAHKLEPALAEVLALPDPPQNVQDAGSALVQANARQVDQLSQVVASRGDADAKQNYADAKRLYLEAKDLWAAGDRREATEKSWQSLEKLDIACRDFWQANAPQARRG